MMPDSTRETRVLPQNNSIPQSGSIGLKHVPHFIADAAETSQNFLLAAGRFGRVVKRPVMAGYLAGENRARLVRIAANGDDGMHRLFQKFPQGFRAMTGNVNARFGHDFDGERMDKTGWFRAGALDIHKVACRRAQKFFGHVAAAGVAGAEDQNYGSGWICHGAI